MNAKPFYMERNVYDYIEKERKKIQENLKLKRQISQTRFSKIWLFPKIKNMNKKASIFDLAFIIIFAIGFALFLLIAGYVLLTINTQLKTTEIGTNPNSATALGWIDNIVSRFDYIFVILYIGLTIGLFISAFLIDSNQIFVPIYIILLALLVIISAVAQHLYQSFASVPEFMSRDIANPMMSYIMNHLIVSSIGIGVISMILIFAKPRNQGGPY